MDQTVQPRPGSGVAGAPALEMCARQGFDPAEALATQFLIEAAAGAVPVPGLDSLVLNDWVLHHGSAVHPIVMRDAKGRVYGAFIGVGVDPDGRLVGPDSFAAFDIDDPGFAGRFQHWVAYTAGRYAVLADSAALRCLLFDPVAHMTVVRDPDGRRAASSVLLVLDRPLQPNPMFDTKAIAQAAASGDTEPNYILGHTQDARVRFCLPNHRLDLDSFRMERIWPLADSFAEETDPQKQAVLVERMVARLRTILGALVSGHPSILAVSGGTDSRKLLACLTDRLDDVAELFAFEHTGYARLDADTGEWVVRDLLNRPFRRYTRADGAPHVPQAAPDRRRRTRLFWLRTSAVALPPNEYALGLTDATPAGHLHLRGNVMDLMRAVWWRSFADRHAKVTLSLRDQIASLFLNPEPSREMVEKWAEEFMAWKMGLPETARPLVYDFIFLELFLHVSSAKYYGYERNFYICPFSDRSLIEMTLCLPVDHRFAGTLNEEFLRVADPQLADQPYRGGVRDLMRRGVWSPVTGGAR